MFAIAQYWTTCHIKNRDKMATLNAVFGRQILKHVVLTGTCMYSTIFHKNVLPNVVNDVRNCISMECLQSSLDCYAEKKTN